jgi:hypothetical protein
MGTALIGILFVGGSVLISVVGLILVRRKVPVSFLETHHDVAGFFIGVLGVIYAVLMGFVVFVVWDDFKEAKVTVALEANQLGDLSRMSKGFPDTVYGRVREGLIHYIEVVINEEWPAMSRGEESPQAWRAMKELWDIYRDIDPKTAKENILYSESLGRLNDLSDSRRLRLHASHDKVHTVIWVLLWCGGIITVVFTYFFGVKSLWSQSLMTAALTAVIAFILFLIFALNHPFAGGVRVTPEVLKEQMQRITNETFG